MESSSRSSKREPQRIPAAPLLIALGNLVLSPKRLDLCLRCSERSGGFEGARRLDPGRASPLCSVYKCTRAPELGMYYESPLQAT